MSLINRTSPSPPGETITDPWAAPDSPSLAALPAFQMPRAPLPGMGNPDPAPEADDHQGAAAASASKGQQTASIPAFFKQRAKSYAKIAETLLTAAGGLLNAQSREDSEAFIPDDDDRETIPPPIGRLMARRIKLGADPDQLSDIEDLGMAAVGVAMWLAKGVTTVWEARRARRRLEADKAIHNETGDGQ